MIFAHMIKLSSNRLYMYLIFLLFIYHYIHILTCTYISWWHFILNIYVFISTEKSYIHTSKRYFSWFVVFVVVAYFHWCTSQIGKLCFSIVEKLNTSADGYWNRNQGQMQRSSTSQNSFFFFFSFLAACRRYSGFLTSIRWYGSCVFFN